MTFKELGKNQSFTFVSKFGPDDPRHFIIWRKAGQKRARGIGFNLAPDGKWSQNDLQEYLGKDFEPVYLSDIVEPGENVTEE